MTRVLLVDAPSIDRLTDLPPSRRREFLGSMDTLGQAVERARRALDAGSRLGGHRLSPPPSCPLTCRGHAAVRPTVYLGGVPGPQ